MGLAVLTGVVSASEKPFFNPKLCLNRRQHKVPCTLCRDICPGQVFSLNPREPLKWDQCTDCGLCVSVCPSRCFAPPPGKQKLYAEDLDLSQPVSFACYEEAAVCTRRVECLAGIPWELAATLALYTHVVFYVGACARCSRAGQVQCLHDNLECLRDFLGAEQFGQRVHIMSEGRFEMPVTNRAVSRRDWFSGLGRSLGRNLARTALNILPSFDNESDSDGFLYRRLLCEAVKQAQGTVAKKEEDGAGSQSSAAPGTASGHNGEMSGQSEKALSSRGGGSSGTVAPAAGMAAVSAVSAVAAARRYGVRLPRYTRACFGCNICERVCPHNALEVSPEKDGKRTIYITPWKCTGCGLCARTCPHGGIRGMHLVRVPHMNRLPLVRVDSQSCAGCGCAVRPGTPDGLCTACARKAAKRVR